MLNLWIIMVILESLTMHLTDEAITWRCSASGHGRFYLVEVLDRTLPTFTLVAYQGEHFNPHHPLETLTIEIKDSGDRSLFGQSREILNGLPLTVIAFKRSLDFVVNHPTLGAARGRCERNIEWE